MCADVLVRFTVTKPYPSARAWVENVLGTYLDPADPKTGFQPEPHEPMDSWAVVAPDSRLPVTEDRAERGLRLLDASRTLTGDDGADDGTAAADAIADVLEALPAADRAKALGLACMHVEAETGHDPRYDRPPVKRRKR